VPGPRPLLRYARGAAIAFEFSSSIAAGALIGWWLDRWLGTAPWSIVGTTVLATVAAFFRLVQILRQFERVDRDG
jgi:ATP synthase protein I